MRYMDRWALIHLEWLRTRASLGLLAGGYLVAVGAALAAPKLLGDLGAAFSLALPILAGLVLGAGLAADDLQQGTMTAMLALPFRRSDLWTLRAAWRCMLLLILVAVWSAVPGILGVRPDWGLSDEGIPPGVLAAAGFLFYGFGATCSVFMRNAFEAVIAAAAAGAVFLSLIQGTASSAGMTILCVVAGMAGAAASRDLFIRREPMQWSALKWRITAWAGGLMALISITLVLY